MKEILFIDDEFSRIEEYLDELDLYLSLFYSYSILFFENLQEAERYIQKNPKKVWLIITDLMFDNNSYRKSDYTGSSAGIAFYLNIKKKYNNIPFIILTNRTKESLEEETRFISKLKNNNDFFLEKIHNTPADLLKKVKDVLL